VIRRFSQEESLAVRGFFICSHGSACQGTMLQSVPARSRKFIQCELDSQPASTGRLTPVIALAIEGDNAVARVRDLLGPTDSKKAAKGTIRGDFGVDVMVNVCHASDSPEDAFAEVKRFFADAEVFRF